MATDPLLARARALLAAEAPPPADTARLPARDPLLERARAIVGTEPTASEPSRPPADSRSVFARAYDVLATPLIGDDTARNWSGAISGQGAPAGRLQIQSQVPVLGPAIDAARAIPDVARNLIAEPVATVRGFLGGAIEGAAAQTSPVDVAGYALGGVGKVPGLIGRAAARQLDGAAHAAQRATRTQHGLAAADVALSGAQVARGTERAISEESPADAWGGVAQAAFGAAAAAGTVPGLRATRSARPGVGLSVDDIVAERELQKASRAAAPQTDEPSGPQYRPLRTEAPADPEAPALLGNAPTETVEADVRLPAATSALQDGGAVATDRDTAIDASLSRTAPGDALLEGVPASSDALLLAGAGGRQALTGDRVFAATEPVHAAVPAAGPIDADARPALRYDKFPEEVRDGLREVVERQHLDVQRRGTQSQARTDALAERLAVDLRRTLAPGTALNAEELRAYANTTATLQERIQDLAKRVSSGDDSAVGVLQQAMAEQHVVVSSLAGARTEAGRALAQLRQVARILDSHDAQIIRSFTDATRDDVRRLADRIASVEDPVAAFHQQRAARKPTFGQTLRSYYLTNLLSGVKTHERNILGNAANSLANLVVTPVAAGVDALTSAARTRPRTITLDELPSQTVGTFLGLQRGLVDGFFTLTHGFSRQGMLRGDLGRVEFAGGGRNPFNYPGRALEAADAVFRSVARNQELYGLAHGIARRELRARGLRGAEAKQFIVERMADLRTGDSAAARLVQAQADRYAQRAVFQEDPGRIAHALASLSRDVPAIGFVLPFVRTPANILRQGLEFSPAGVAMKATRATGREGAQAQARAAMGTLLLAPMAWYASQGRISGSGPSDPAERERLMASGWRPNAVKVPLSDDTARRLSAARADDGEYWVSYQLLQPIAVPMSIVANGFEAWREAENKETGAQELASMIAAKTANSVFQQSYLAGVNGLLGALSDPQRHAESFFSRSAQGLVPFSSLLRETTRATDATVRQPKGVAESLKANLPGLSAQVPARLDRFGEPIARSGTALRRGFVVPEVEPSRQDAVASELARVEVRLGRPTERIVLKNRRGEPVPLTRADGRAVQQARGQAVRFELERVMASDVYQRADDERRAELLERAVLQARRDVGARAKRATLRGEDLAVQRLVPPQRQEARRSTVLNLPLRQE